MCELLGLSSNHETSINLSLTVLAERGENPKLHGDGWGVAFYEGNDVRLIKDAGEAKGSDWVEFIKDQMIRSHDIIAHIRKSTIGEVTYRNTHPFIREIHGRIHTFAHNGTLKNIDQYQTTLFSPVGTTDSERAFCILMERMYELWKNYDGKPPLKERFEVVRDFSHEMVQLGPLNFLYSDGETLFAHGSKRHDPIADKVSWPGLHYTQVKSGNTAVGFDECLKSAISISGKHKKVTLFASVPLNDQKWVPLKENELLAVTKGEIIFSSL